MSLGKYDSTANSLDDGDRNGQNAHKSDQKNNNPPDERDEEVDRKAPSKKGDSNNFSDPAIMMMKLPEVQYRYTRDELIAYKDSPLSKIRPTYLDVVFDNSNGIWDPELWHYNRKSTEAPVENGVMLAPDMDNRRRRTGDPRERLRKEGDGIVLSPQRRSFNSGCYVPVRESQRSNRGHSPLGKPEPPHITGHRELPTVVPRRIGSGRIPISWDFQEKHENDEFNYRRDRRENDRDDRFERRSFGRDFDMNRDKDKERHSGRNGRNDRRRISDSKEEEPEWFSGGPLSQNDTIELRGFEDSDRGIGKKKRSATQKKKSIERAIAKNNEKQASHPDIEEECELKGSRSTPTPPSGNSLGRQGNMGSPRVDIGGGGDAPPDCKTETKGFSDQQPLDLDDILKCDTFSGFMSNGVVEEGAGSKFSRWFKKEKSSPSKQPDLESRRSSVHEDQHHFINNILSDISETSVSIPGDSDSYFAPISPAANTGGAIGGPTGPPAGSKPISLMEMFQRGKQKVPVVGDAPPAMKNIGKVLSLEELEARMLPPGGSADVGTIGAPMQPKPQQKSEDVDAFRRLLAQVAEPNNHSIPQNGPMLHPQQPPMSILEMLSHSQQQDEAARIAMMGNANPNALNDLSYKLQQVQSQVQRQVHLEMMLSKAQRKERTPPPFVEMGLAQSRELLNRPEAQAILQGLKRGDLTPQHLYQQLANPAMQPRHRELLHTILKLQGNGTAMGPSPRVLSPVPPTPHPMFQQQQQQQQLRVSPLPNAMHQRIPSPRELQVHTQNIMQRALIKKKLEEQQENYRKKQEMQQRGTSPSGGLSPAKNVPSPTPLAFTPTSVLRKMTADKEEVLKDANKNTENQNKTQPQGRAVTGMKPQPQPLQPIQPNQQPQQSAHQWNTQFPQMKQPGRPIVKANANFQQANAQQQPDQFYQQQQRVYNQQQRKPSQQFPGSNPQNQYQQQFSNQQFNQMTQQQLRAQHQQQHVRSQHQQQQPQSQQGFGSQSGLNWQQMLQGQNFDNRNNRQVGRSDAHGGDLSPTSNQLARWFSPELLERARRGNVPNMPNNITLHALSLEDIERPVTASAVQN